jgi:hypothetical protein
MLSMLFGNIVNAKHICLVIHICTNLESCHCKAIIPLTFAVQCSAITFNEFKLMFSKVRYRDDDIVAIFNLLFTGFGKCFFGTDVFNVFKLIFSKVRYRDDDIVAIFNLLFTGFGKCFFGTLWFTRELVRHRSNCCLAFFLQVRFPFILGTYIFCCIHQGFFRIVFTVVNKYQ